MSGTPWIPNPYSYFIRKRARRVDGKLGAAQHTTATSSNYFFPFLLRLLLPADSPDTTQPGVINFPSPSFPPRGKTTVLLTGTRDGRRARLWNRTHVRQTESAPSSRRGGGKGGLTEGPNSPTHTPSGCGTGCRAVRCGRWTLAFRQMRGKNPSVATVQPRAALLNMLRERNTGNLEPREAPRHERAGAVH